MFCLNNNYLISSAVIRLFTNFVFLFKSDIKFNSYKKNKIKIKKLIFHYKKNHLLFKKLVTKIIN